MSSLQTLFAENGRNSLAINLSLDVNDRHGFLPCDVQHTHTMEDASEELAVWLTWLQSIDVQSRVSSLVDNGVRFYICENTLDSIERNSGSRPKINPNAIPVKAGVVKLIESVAKGYTLVRP